MTLTQLVEVLALREGVMKKVKVSLSVLTFAIDPVGHDRKGVKEKLVERGKQLEQISQAFSSSTITRLVVSPRKTDLLKGMLRESLLDDFPGLHSFC
jgi:hypothetical protein